MTPSATPSAAPSATTTTASFPPTRADVAYIETLTDEELAVLGGEDPLAVRPYYDELPLTAQEVAKQVAFRGLLARGIVDPPSAEAVESARARGGSPDLAVDVMVREDVQSLIELRRGSPMLVALARTTSEGHDYWYGYLFDDMALIEEITETGLHRFSLIRENQLLDLLVGAAVHPAAADAAGEPVRMPDDVQGRPTAPILQTLGQALLRADFVVRHRSDVAPQVVGLFTGPTGSWLVTHRGAEPSIAVPMRAEQLREQVRALVREARELVGRRG